jgi:tetratricopeptide (TPR) repeat protein
MMMTPLQVNGTTPPKGACLDAELLASYVDGRATPEERVEVEAHLARCEDCYFAFSETVQEQQAEGTADEVEAQGHRRRWLPRVAAGLATAAAVVIAVQLFRSVVSPVTAPDVELKTALEQLDAATGPSRRFEPRLTLISTYRPLEPAMRSAAPSAEAPLDVREAALGVEKASTKPGTGLEGQRALATMYFALGRAQRAADVLGPSAQSDDAGALSDLAAAYLARRSVGDVQRALDLLERAVGLDPNRVEAWFNLGLAAEAADQRARAAEAWTRALALDSTSGWADEARKHLEKLKVP